MRTLLQPSGQAAIAPMPSQPRAVASPARAHAERFAQRIRQVAAARAQLRIEGGGTRRGVGDEPAGEVLSAASLTGVVAYDPGDLVITACSGTRLDELDQVLAANQQMLAFEPPGGPGSTIGGAVALGWSGPRRPYAGATRDHVIGVRMLDGRGRLLRFGGEVVKNVAGFDLARLMVGSKGALGLLLEISLRVIPRPAVERTVLMPCAAEEALRTLHRLPMGPGVISAAAYIGGCLYVRASGSPASVDAALRQLRGTDLNHAHAFWSSFNNQSLGPYAVAPGRRLWRLSLQPGAAGLPPYELVAIDWGGAVQWISAPLDCGDGPRQWAAAHGGHAAAWSTCSGDIGSGELDRNVPDGLLALHRRLCHVFDPHGVFDATRLDTRLRRGLPACA